MPFGRTPTEQENAAFGQALMAAFQRADDRGLALDLIRFVGKLPNQDLPSFAQALPFARGELVDLEIDGDRAHAMLSGKPARFARQQDHRWYLVSNDDGDDEDTSDAPGEEAATD